ALSEKQKAEFNKDHLRKFLFFSGAINFGSLILLDFTSSMFLKK
ncbi:MAG: hypothetical protein PWQ22_1375, partial [Archaeoglobaceae archaeon]|nr:hypothetical protein [Archaeoglobaceae archaeon]